MGCLRFFQTTSKIKQKKSPKFVHTTSKTNTRDPRHSLNCFKNKTLDHQDSFKLLQKQNKRNLRDSFKLLQKPDTKGPRDSLKKNNRKPREGQGVNQITSKTKQKKS